jgi:hypothetical protein
MKFKNKKLKKYVFKFIMEYYLEHKHKFMSIQVECDASITSCSTVQNKVKNGQNVPNCGLKWLIV